MVSRGASFTVIGNQSSLPDFHPGNRSEHKQDREDAHPLPPHQQFSTSDDATDNPSSFFLPPMATWYDRAHQHFVAFLGVNPEETSSKAVQMMDHNGNFIGNEFGEYVYYQILQFPSVTSQSTSKSLDGSKVYPLFLPYTLSRQIDATSSSDRATILKSSPQIPLLAKVSPHKNLLALQINLELVIVLQLSNHKDHPTKKNRGNQSSSSQKAQFWTLNIPHDCPPLFPESFPEHWDIETRVTTILPGGLIWNNGDATSQDLIIVTTNAVLFYKTSTRRDQIQIYKSNLVKHPGDAMWYEPSTRTLLVGSYIPHKSNHFETPTTPSKEKDPSNVHPPKNDNDDSNPKSMNSTKEERVFVIQTYFLPFPKPNSSKPKNLFDSLFSASYTFANLETQLPGRLPLFVLGSKRLEYTEDGKNVGKRRSITCNDISIVNLNNEAYCIELGCWGTNEGITIIHLDKHNRRAQVVRSVKHEGEGFYGISVIDHLLAFHYKESNCTLLFDIRKIGEGRTVCKSYKSKNPNPLLLEKCCSLLPPNLILDPRERGSVCFLELDLNAILWEIPLSACVVPFLLNRIDTRARSIALSRLNTIIKNQDGVALNKSLWVECITEAYSMQDLATVWDIESCNPILVRCTMLPSNSGSISISEFIRKYEQDLPSTCPTPPSNFDSILTQTEVLEQILLPNAEESITNNNLGMFQFVCMISCHLMESLTAEYIEVCPALEALVISMLWRLGEAEKVLGILRSRRHRLGLKKENVPDADNTSNIKDKLRNIEKEKDSKFAEMVVIISNDLELGIGVGKKNGRKNTFYSSVNQSYTKALKAISFDMMSSTLSYQVVARHLLYAGRIQDAMCTCLKEIEPRNAGSASPKNVQNVIVAREPTSKEFFQASIEYCEKIEDIAERIQHFNLLFAFLKEWDHGSVGLPKKKFEDKESKLALELDFPNYLFGEQSKEYRHKLCSMFGYKVPSTHAH